LRVSAYQEIKEVIALLLGCELDKDFRVDDVTDNQRYLIGCVVDDCCSGVGEGLVRDQDVEQDVGVDGADHLLGSAATHIIYELVDGGVAQFGEAVFAVATPFRKV
jgi:hypothetical protein